LGSFFIEPAKAQLWSRSPKFINIDLQPYQTVQAYERADIMNIGGFSDAVFARDQCVHSRQQPAIRR
jgi:hypothetical protein